MTSSYGVVLVLEEKSQWIRRKVDFLETDQADERIRHF